MRIRLWLDETYHMRVSQETLYNAVAHLAARRKTFHPVKSYLESVAPQWDGCLRLDTFGTDYLGARSKTGSHDLFCRWFLISAVARVLSPGCKVDSCLILEGPQGAGKSQAVNILAGPWCADSPIVIGSKDAFINLRGVWIAELAELAAFMHKAPDAIKEFLSSPVDRYRPPWAPDAENFPRQCVFVGTINHKTYLQDPTGARRFYSVRVGHIDKEALVTDRDQLWAEAFYRYQRGDKWWPETAEQDKLCERAQEDRFKGDSWEPAVLELLTSAELMMELRAEGVTVDEILLALDIPRRDHDRARQDRVLGILERLGFYPARPRRKNGTRPRAFLPPKRWPPEQD